MANANVVQTSVSGGIQNALALQGDGVFFPKVSTASRLALTLGTSDAGFTVYDSQVGNLYFWTGTAWQSVPNSGSPGLNGQVQYNNNGTVQGATGFTFDNATNAVSMGGDLTVDTSTLKVTASTDTVTVGATTTDAKFRVIDANYNGLRIGFLPGTANYNLYDATVHEFRTANVTPQILYSFSATSAIWGDGAGGTRMTLNSSGLGVGVASPAIKLDVVDAGNTFAARFRGNGGTNFVAIGTTGFGASINGYTAGFAAVADLVLQPNGGNVGVGVTPSAWGSSLKAFELGAKGNALFTTAAVIDGLFMVNNAYFDTGYKYAVNGYASRYTQYQAAHQWFNAPSGTAGNAITFTQAMTLDASGNLLVGKTATNSLTVGNEVRANGEVFSNQASSGNAATTYHVYSTGAAAYRFYVGLGGTVFATNTTISAISDARLKENVQDIDVGLGAILALKPRKFDWKAGKGKDIKGDRGFIAQEFEQVFPNLIDEWKDEALEGEAPYKSVRQDLIPVLVKAIQELTAEVNALKNA
jgi:hypothetical protein